MRLKMLGVTVVAVLALTAVVASAAQAASFHSELEGTTTLNGTQTGNHVFNAAGATITCKNATFTGMQTGKVANDVTVAATYKNCSFLFFNVNVNMNGCEYKFHSNNTVDVVGASCKGITYEGAGCKVVVPAQSGLSTVGFATEDDWFDYQLENDPRFLRRIEQARHSLAAGKGVKLEDLPEGKRSAKR